jgi:ubiquinone/menaquinone biosynthesis C-methylase UbiE
MAASSPAQNFAEVYERSLVGPLFRPFAELLIEGLGVEPNHRFLDIACGTGIVARLAKRRGVAAAVGVDLNPAMLAVARTAAADVDWREGNACALPLGENERFDVVACHQGLQFFPDRPGAAQEMHRALAPDGRLALGTWRSDEELPFLRRLRAIAERRLGPIVDRRYALGDPGVVEVLLKEAGFREIRSKVVALTVRFDDVRFVHLNAIALVGMSASGASMSSEERELMAAAIAEDSAEAVPAGKTGLAFELASNVVTAQA